jgi:hypothetical protein
MSEKITSLNLDEVVKRNKKIHSDMWEKALIVRINWNTMKISVPGQLALQILKSYGIVQVPVENQYWGGAIFVRNGKKIPVINTALPRVNQCFNAWHEVYHLIFDTVSFNHVISAETVMEERKADYFASLMLLGNIMPYYNELGEMDFLPRIFHCMDAFTAPYKAVLIALYESAAENGNEALKNLIKENFDNTFTDLAGIFRSLGLDDSLVKPSYVINVSSLQTKIAERIRENPDLQYNYENEKFLNTTIKELNLLTEDAGA